MKEFCTLRAKTYSYLMNDNSEIKKAKGTCREAKKMCNKTRAYV